MNKIESLINQLCPNGVVHKNLGDLIKIEKGKQLNKTHLFEKYEEGLYPVINGGIAPSGYWNEYNYNENLITISQGGASAGYVNYIETKFWAGAHCYVVTSVNKEIMYRYVYHFLKSKEVELQNSQVGAGIPSVSLKDINNLENGDEVSLLGKWLPSINTSSKEVINMGKYLAKKLGLKYKEYRKLLTRLRNAPNIKNISLINNVLSNRDIDIEFLKEMSKVVSTSNTLVIKDDSYSMGCNNISVALLNHFTCYFAGLLKGKFNNKYLNFSSDGKMMKFKSDNFEDKLKELENYNVHGNLCLSKILKELLVEYKQGVENSEMIDRILIITDTEFELSIEDDKNYDGVVKEYSSLGFRKPEIIYWNINCNRITYTKHIKYSNVICVNGVDCSVIKALVNYNSLSDIEFIKESIKRYTFVDQILI